MTRREPPDVPDVVEAPEDFDDEQVEVFDAIVSRLAAVGIVVKLSDAYAVERASVALVSARRARAYIVEHGRYHSGKNGLTLHPAVRDEKNAWDAFSSAGSSLGLSPLDRERIQANEAPEDDPHDEVMKEYMEELAADRAAFEADDKPAPSKSKRAAATPAKGKKAAPAKVKAKAKPKAPAKRAQTKRKK